MPNFIDIRAFTHARREGAYVADAALGEYIGQMLQMADRPTFIFAITMENHGPLHLEQPRPGDAEQFYHSQPPKGCNELTVYLRHLYNVDAMFGTLADVMDSLQRPASLCIYGDNVPIMPQDYSILKILYGTVPYLCWHNHHAQKIFYLIYIIMNSFWLPMNWAEPGWIQYSWGQHAYYKTL